MKQEQIGTLIDTKRKIAEIRHGLDMVDSGLDHVFNTLGLSISVSFDGRTKGGKKLRGVRRHAGRAGHAYHSTLEKNGGIALVDRVAKILKGKKNGMKASEIADKLLEQGYVTQSKQFPTVVHAGMVGGRGRKLFKRDAENRWSLK